MRKGFYSKLALTNLKSNHKTYYPYILTAMLTVIMFYNIASITYHSQTIRSMSLASLMSLGTIITGIFSVVLLFYTNSFLMKRRTKELGLYNILGMEKRHIGRIMLWENIYTGVISVGIGTGLGILFNKLITLAMYKVLHFDPNYSFQVSPIAVVMTLVLFFGIFLLILLNNLRQVHFAKPIELLQSSNAGEKEPKTRWIMAVLGAICLGAGYYISISVKSPLEAFALFFVAVLLVIAGTYFLFIAGSIAMLKGLKKNKTYYYKTNHFTAISGMIYRMKRNAAGLATICILSTAVLVMVGTTVSLYAGMDDVLSTRYPRDIVATARYELESNLDTEALEKYLDSKVAEKGLTKKNGFGYKNMGVAAKREEDSFILTTDVDASDVYTINFFTLDEFNRIQGTNETLASNEVLLHDNRNKGLAEGGYISIQDTQFKIKTKYKELEMPDDSWGISNAIILVLPSDDAFRQMYELQKSVYGDASSTVTYMNAFDVNGTDAEKIALADAMSMFHNEYGVFGDEGFNSLSFECKQASVDSFFELYGGMLFLCIFLAVQFLMATVLIIYYKQVVEGYEDKGRFVIMKKVGMSDREVRKSIHSQILTVFALPLAMAAAHVFAAFPILSKLLAVLNLRNASLFLLCLVITIGIFAVGYVVVYSLTAKVYYRIVGSDN